MKTVENCRLCKEHKEQENIIFQTDNFFVVPSLGQIVEGYLLICPKEHYLGLAHIPENYFKELKKVKERVKEVVSQAYTTPVFFEHGPISKKEKGGCSVDHAHLHVVPVEEDIQENIAENFPQKKIDDLVEITEFAKEGNPYFYYENRRGEKYSYPLSEPVPSQYLRRLIAAKIGKKEKWDWKRYPGIKKFNKTIKKLK